MKRKEIQPYTIGQIFYVPTAECPQNPPTPYRYRVLRRHRDFGYWGMRLRIRRTLRSPRQLSRTDLSLLERCAARMSERDLVEWLDA
jgi:hypothetical protein